MKRPGSKSKKNVAIAMALTWDGARFPTKKLPPKARAFLGAAFENPPTTGKISRLFADDAVTEIRICWVPQLKGGKSVLTNPFSMPTGRRLGFAAARTIRLGDHLGVIYRRLS